MERKNVYQPFLFLIAESGPLKYLIEKSRFPQVIFIAIVETELKKQKLPFQK